MTDEHFQPPAGDPVLAELVARPDGWALFFDIDGTLIDIAATPEGVAVPDGLPDDLFALSERLAGALALVTGRSLDVVDRLMAPHRFTAAGLHGAERRVSGKCPVRPVATDAFERLKAELSLRIERLSGVLLEDKGAAVALHYRLAPAMVDTVEDIMRRAAAVAGPDFELQRGKMVLELRPKASKAEAIVALMAEPAFEGRRPLCLGDDITDETMFAAANALGGHAIRVGTDLETETLAGSRLATPADVHQLVLALLRA